jgi:hypothetical protein
MQQTQIHKINKRFKFNWRNLQGYMKTNFTFLFLFCNFLYCKAQTPAFQWAKHIGGIASEQAYSVKTDLAGNSYICGTFSGTTDLDPGPNVFSVTGSSDFYILKLDVLGNFVWAKKIGGTSDDAVNAMAIDENANCYLTGYFRGTVDFDPSAAVFSVSSPGSSRDVFILKLDADGDFKWVKTFSGGLNEEGFAICLDQQNNIYTTGYFQHNVDFDPGANSFSLSSNGVTVDDIFISKLDSAGNFVWAKRIGASLNDLGRSIDIDGTNDVLLTGHFRGNVDFDPGAGTTMLNAVGDTDIFMLKLDHNGNFKWASRVGGSGEDMGYSIHHDASNNIVIAGHFSGTVDFDQGLALQNLTASSRDAFTLKVNADGNFMWVKQTGGSSTDRALAVLCDASKNVFTIGYYFGTADLDPSTAVLSSISNGGYDVFITKLDSSGNLVWTRSFGGTANDIAYACTLDALQQLTIVGSFSASLDADPDSTQSFVITASSTTTDAFFIRWNQGNCVAPTLPTIHASSSTICAGDSCLLTLQNDTLHSATQWIWYSNACGGTSIGMGDSLLIQPQNNTTYYVRGEGNCFTAGNCVSIAITVNNLPQVQATPIIGCLGDTVQLIASPIGGIFSVQNPYQGIDTTYQYTYTDTNGCTATTPPISIQMDTCLLNLQLKFFIEGFYTGNQTMAPVLWNQGVLGSSSITDAVLVVLHESTPPFLPKATTTALCATNGITPCTMAISTGYYFIEIIHRNAVSTWSASPVYIGSGLNMFDFSSSQSSAYGNNMLEIESGVFAFYSGDINVDDNIDLQDAINMEDDIYQFASGYFSSDVNGDGNVDLQDFSLLENNLNNFIYAQQPSP